MSTYKSQLKAWAVDRATKVLEGGNEPFAVNDVLEVSDQLVEYAYNQSEDFDNAAKNLFEIVHNSKSDMTLNIEFLIDNLQLIKEQRQAHGLDQKQEQEAAA